MLITKRDGSKVEFDKTKLITAINNANNQTRPKYKLTKARITEIVDIIASIYESGGKTRSVEFLQDLVEEQLVEAGAYGVAKEYITYRYKKDLARKFNTTDASIKELLDGNSEYWNRENSNKNARLVTTQRDYIAGITSTDITKRLLLPKDVVEAHDAGIIHFHDADYFAQSALHNCELCNLNDMLQNGTIVNGVMIEKPHRLLTATTIATQIIAAVTSSSYGGCTVSLTHLAPFVRDSYNRYYKKYKDLHFPGFLCKKLATLDTKTEIKDSVQTFNYQTNSMTNTNG